jgi:hypothetical protein
VARVELFPPSSATFVLQATVPVPRGTYPRADGLSPFALRDTDGSLVPAQTEIVSRYAEDDAGADVVEVAALVHRPEIASTVEPARYDVVFSPHDEDVLPLHPLIDGLLNTDRALLLKARDVFGNVYALDPLRENLPVKRMRDGSAIHEVRTHGSMMPIAPHGAPNATLPHFLGVHTYVRTFAGAPILEIDLRIHNGSSGLLQTEAYDDPLGTVYFDSFDLDVPPGWCVRDADPDSFAAGPFTEGDHERYYIIRPNRDGTLHMMPRQAQTTRRLVIYRPENFRQAYDYVRDQNLAFVRGGRNAQGEDLFSWWNPATARYFTQRRRLPDLQHVPIDSVRAEQQVHADTLANTLRTGIAPGYPLMTNALGWCNPYGVPHGGMAGGDEIVMYNGLRALAAGTNAGWRALAMEHRMYTDRQPAALYNIDGEPTDYEQWVVHDWSGSWLPIVCFLVPLLWAADPFGFNSAPTFQVDYVKANHLDPAYEAALDEYAPIDFEHYVRYTSPAKALVWIGNDSLAKDALLLSAQLFRLGYNELPNSQYSWYIPTGLADDDQYVTANPGVGLSFGRLESWGLDSVISAYAIGDPSFRTRVKPWFDKVVSVLERGQSQCTGIIEAMLGEQLFQGHYRARQSIEQAITENMLISLRESVYRNADPLNTGKIDTILNASLHAMVSPPCWSDAAHAPWSKLAVGDGDPSHPPFCDAVPPDAYADGGDSYQCWNSFAWGFDLTQEPIFLERAAEMAHTGTAPLITTLRAAGLDNIENRAALLALLQELQ